MLPEAEPICRGLVDELGAAGLSCETTNGHALFRLGGTRTAASFYQPGILRTMVPSFVRQKVLAWQCVVDDGDLIYWLFTIGTEGVLLLALRSPMNERIAGRCFEIARQLDGLLFPPLPPAAEVALRK